HLPDLPILQQQAHPKAIHTRVVADDREIPDALISDRADEIFRNATQPESTHHNRGAVLHVGDRVTRVAHDLIHSESPRLNSLSIGSIVPACIESKTVCSRWMKACSSCGKKPEVSKISRQT